MNKILVFLLTVSFAAQAWADPAKVLYQNNFEKEEAGKTPADFLVLEGDFTVKEDGGNKFLELPGAPLDAFGGLFGPTTNAGVCVGARILGTGKGRRFPTFAIGLAGAGGYKLQVSPAKGVVEILKGDAVRGSMLYAWKTGTWTQLRLQVERAGDGWKVEGKAWSDGQPEPPTWNVSVAEASPPPPGRASFWGSPFSGTPIWFDDLVLTQAH